MPPLQPPKPMVKLVTGSAREFEVRFPAVVSMNGESAIRRFHIYHANEPTMNERFLIGEIDPVVELTQAIEKDELIFAYKDPQPLINHYFQISSVNALGEGPRSEVSDVYFIGKKERSKGGKYGYLELISILFL